MRPEQLLPAGLLKMMDYAFAYGADAIKAVPSKGHLVF